MGDECPGKRMKIQQKSKYGKQYPGQPNPDKKKNIQDMGAL